MERCIVEKRWEDTDFQRVKLILLYIAGHIGLRDLGHLLYLQSAR